MPGDVLGTATPLQAHGPEGRFRVRDRHGERGGRRRPVGDGGKGKIVDWLSERRVVVRFQGGHNAGHTLVIGNQTYKPRALPGASGQTAVMAAWSSIPGTFSKR